jgi:hypothetical protein
MFRLWYQGTTDLNKGTKEEHNFKKKRFIYFIINKRRKKKQNGKKKKRKKDTKKYLQLPRSKKRFVVHAGGVRWFTETRQDIVHHPIEFAAVVVVGFSSFETVCHLTKPTFFCHIVHHLFNDDMTTTDERKTEINIVVVDDDDVVVVDRIGIGGGGGSTTGTRTRSLMKRKKNIMREKKINIRLTYLNIHPKGEDVKCLHLLGVTRTKTLHTSKENGRHFGISSIGHFFSRKEKDNIENSER